MLTTKFRFVWSSGFGENKIKNRPIRNKNCLWWSCLLTDRDELSNLYRGPSIDATYQVPVHLAKRLWRSRFLEIGQSETTITCGGHVLLTDRDEMSNLYRGPSIDASYQVSVHLAKQFPRRFLRAIKQSETRIVCGGYIC